MENKNSIFHKGKESINFKKKRFDGWQPITAVFTVANEGKIVYSSNVLVMDYRFTPPKKHFLKSDTGNLIKKKSG